LVVFNFYFVKFYFKKQTRQYSSGIRKNAFSIDHPDACKIEAKYNKTLIFLGTERETFLLE